MSRHDPGTGFPIRAPPAKLARQLTEAFRSLATPFVGPWPQGIHRDLWCVGCVWYVGQVIKGLRWMPWGQGPKKGVARLRKASVSRLAGLAGGARMGKPIPGHTGIPA